MKPEQKAAVEASLEEFGEAQVKVGGYSMWPFIKPGDVIYITSEVGEKIFSRVAVFWAEKQLIAHRIVGKNNSKSGKSVLKISADFSRNSETFIGREKIIGVVFKLKRGEHFTSKWVTPPLSYLAIFLGFFLKIINFQKGPPH